jgi:HEAT repeat protein
MVEPRRLYYLGDITLTFHPGPSSMVAPGLTQIGKAELRWTTNHALANWVKANYGAQNAQNKFVTATVSPQPILGFSGVYMAGVDGNNYSFTDFRTSEELITALEDPDERDDAIISLGERKAKGATSALLKCADDSKSKTREYAVDALGEIGGEDAVRKLREVAEKDPDANVRKKAAEALKKAAK